MGMSKKKNSWKLLYSKKFCLLLGQILSAYFLFCGRTFGQLATQHCLGWRCWSEDSKEPVQENLTGKYFICIFFVLRPNFRPAGNTTLPWLALLIRRLQRTSPRKPYGGVNQRHYWQQILGRKKIIMLVNTVNDAINFDGCFVRIIEICFHI